MSKLKPVLPLEGYARKWADLTLKEYYIGEMVSLAVAQGQENAFIKAFKKEFGSAPPKPSEVIPISDGLAMWSGVDQYLLLLNGENINADRELAAKLGATAYTTLQTDGWASFDLSSSRAYDVLERFTAFDLRNAPVQYAARTMAHHMPVVIMKFSATEFQLMTPRSSAQSFLNALTHTIDNVLG